MGKVYSMMFFPQEEILKKHTNWEPSDHVEEFVNLAKELMFVAQGDPKAPVTTLNLINKINEHVHNASKFETIVFWTPEQLSVIQALEEVRYLFLDAFYSTGKSILLMYVANYWSKSISKFFDRM